jgi:hypothetical protein
MSTDADLPSEFVIPRPGVVKTLGILNVVFSVVLLIGLLMGIYWLYAMAMAGTALREKGGPPSADATVTLFGMEDPKVFRFTLVDVVTGGVLNFMMLASGIGLINIKRWGARLWTWTAWIKLVRLVLLWGFYIIAVTPSFSESMARSAVAMIPKMGARGAPTVGELTRVYAIMNLIVAIFMMVFGAIYPILSLWMLGRPGVRVALEREALKEPELP